MSKPKGRFLFTWNEKKHPEVVEFFDQIEEGLYSHYIREAIAFYVKHNQRDGQPPETSNKEVQEALMQVEKNSEPKDNSINQKPENDSDWGVFSPNMVGD